jgi:mycothiol synthase
MPMPAGFRLRPARDEDVAAVVAFSNAESEALIGTPLMTVEVLLREWTAPGVERENDVAVVEAPGGELCGYLSVESDPPYTEVFALGVVALPFHRRGIGAALVEENERRATRFLGLAPAGARVLLHVDALTGEPRVSELLAGRGYREVRRFELMRTEFAESPSSPAAIPGIALRSMRDGDEEAIYAVHRQAFADHWGEGEPTFESFRHGALAGSDFDPALWTLAWDGDRLAGYVGATPMSKEKPEHGYVKLLGVHRDYRRRGIAEALLRTAFGQLAARGRRGCDLHVDAESPTGATRLYERVGMVANPRFATWEKELRPAGG